MYPFPRRCGKCGQKAMELVSIPYSITIKHDGRSYNVQLPALRVPRCANCGGITIDPEADRQISLAFYRQANLLLPEEIRQGREKLGITQKLFARLLYLGESTISRWETGAQIQQRSLDRYLRHAFKHPEILRENATDLPQDERQDVEDELERFLNPPTPPSQTRRRTISRAE